MFGARSPPATQRERISLASEFSFSIRLHDILIDPGFCGRSVLKEPFADKALDHFIAPFGGRERAEPVGSAKRAACQRPEPGVTLRNAPAEFRRRLSRAFPPVHWAPCGAPRGRGARRQRRVGCGRKRLQKSQPAEPIGGRRGVSSFCSAPGCSDCSLCCGDDRVAGSGPQGAGSLAARRWRLCARVAARRNERRD